MVLSIQTVLILVLVAFILGMLVVLQSSRY